MIADITFAQMQPLLNNKFVLKTKEGSELYIELVEVAQNLEKNKPQYSFQKGSTETVTPVADKRIPFTLVFQIPTELGATQGMYTISHAEKGALGDIFLVPIAEDEAGLYFEALFN